MASRRAHRATLNIKVSSVFMACGVEPARLPTKELAIKRWATEGTMRKWVRYDQARKRNLECGIRRTWRCGRRGRGSAYGLRGNPAGDPYIAGDGWVD